MVSALSAAEQKRLNALLRKLLLAFEAAPRVRAAHASA